MFVLDTNTLIYFFKGQGRIAERLLSMPPAEIAVPAVVVYELEVGIAKSSQPTKRRRQLDDLLDAISVWPLDRDAANAAATIRARLEAKGEPIGTLDILIAGTALSKRAILVTRNEREFKRVQGLSVANWFD